MKVKIKNFLFIGLFVALFLFNAFISECKFVFAAPQEKAAHFGNIQLYSSTTSTETIYFTQRDEQSSATVNNVPLYQKQTILSNSCGATAGAIVVGFYDKYYENLIPDYTSYFTATGRYKPADRVYVPALIENLYYLMETNVEDVGVSEDECLNGLRKYVQNASLSIDYKSVKSGGKLDETAYVNSIKANKPVLIFAQSLELVNGISVSSDRDVLSKISMNDNHVYVGYGYYKINYYTDNTVRTDTYMKVACGLAGMLYGYIRISSTASPVSFGWLANAYSVTIL